jgi:hypothetical protein
VTSFGNYCFSECSSLSSFTIPASVSQIGVYIFQNCFSLQSFSISFVALPTIASQEFGQKEKSFFTHASSDVFVGCPFNST